MRKIVQETIISSIQTVLALVQVILTRWLFDLSSPKKDYLWLIRQPWFDYLEDLKFYRGLAYYHELRFRRLVAGL